MRRSAIDRGLQLATCNALCQPATSAALRPHPPADCAQPPTDGLSSRTFAPIACAAAKGPINAASDSHPLVSGSLTTAQELLTYVNEPLTTAQEPLTYVNKPLTTAQGLLTYVNKPLTTAQEPLTYVKLSLTYVNESRSPLQAPLSHPPHGDSYRAGAGLGGWGRF